MSTTYNGWVNYETWRVNLELVDGMTIEDFGYTVRDLDMDDQEKLVEDISGSLEEYVDEVILQDAKGFALDLAQTFLARVNFEEIAEHMVADYISENI